VVALLREARHEGARLRRSISKPRGARGEYARKLQFDGTQLEGTDGSHSNIIPVYQFVWSVKQVAAIVSRMGARSRAPATTRPCWFNRRQP
jgi:hypothetical protein